MLAQVSGPDQKLPTPKKHLLFALFSSLWFAVSLCALSSMCITEESYLNLQSLVLGPSNPVPGAAAGGQAGVSFCP